MKTGEIARKFARAQSFRLKDSVFPRYGKSDTYQVSGTNIFIFFKKSKEGVVMKTLIALLWVIVGVLLGKISRQQLEGIFPSQAETESAVANNVNVVTAVYPDWVVKRLTPGLEKGFSSGINHPKLLLHKKQESRERITGNEIFAWLLSDQKTYQAKEGDLINKCIELADIQFYEKYPHLIPSEWKGKLVYAWKSAVLDGNGLRCVPFLNCDVDEPFVGWYDLGSGWNDNEPACSQE